MERLTGRKLCAGRAYYEKCGVVECADECSVCEVPKEALKKLKEYEDLEERLQNVYGECDGLLENVVVGLEKHERAEFEKPIKVRLLTDDDVDRWEAYKAIDTAEECREAKKFRESAERIKHGEYVPILKMAEQLEQAADIIESLSAKLQAANMESLKMKLSGHEAVAEKAARVLQEAKEYVDKLKKRYMDGHPVEYGGQDESDEIKCPYCGFGVAMNDDFAELKPKHCPECGTKLIY